MTTRGHPTWPWTAADCDALPDPERLLVEAARLWQRARRRNEPGALALRGPFLAEDAMPALSPYARLLDAAEPVGLGCPLCPAVTEAEARLLHACALGQRGDRTEALGGLLRWLSLGRAAAALGPVIALGGALRGAGLLLRHPWRVSAGTATPRA